MSESANLTRESNEAYAHTEQSAPHWHLRRRLVIGITNYLMWGLPVVIGLDLFFDRDFTETLGVPALSGIIGLPGGYLVGRSVQTVMRERRSPS